MISPSIGNRSPFLRFINFHLSSVTRLRSHLKRGVTRKQNTPNFPENENLLPPDRHTYDDLDVHKIFHKLTFLTSLQARAYQGKI